MDGPDAHLSDAEPGRTAVAVQRGAAHGAFQWGVLDRLLETGGLHASGTPFPELCGVSSGALNAVALAQGWAHGGAEGARHALRRVMGWPGGSAGADSAARRVPGALDAGVGHQQHGRLAHGLEAIRRLWGPELLNPFGINPLRAIVDRLIDHEVLTSSQAPRVLVGVTDVETGRPVLFDNASITAEVLLASCCLPFLFAPVRIDGRTSWDGGYAGNPPLHPLLRSEPPDTLVLIRAQTTARARVPHTAQGIINRLHELASQNVLDTELALLPPGVQLIDYRADGVLDELPMSSKFNIDGEFLHMLFDAGRKARLVAIGPVRRAA